MLDMRLRKDTDTGLHEKEFVEEKHLGADPGIVGGGIVSQGEFAERVGRGTFETGPKQPRNL